MAKRPPAGRGSAVRLGDLAYHQIKRDILGCLLPPGVEITEARLALRYGLGKAPVRAALLRLRQEGLVKSVARRGYLVTPVTVKDVQDLFEFRLLLEPGTARLAAGRIDKDGVRRLRALCRADRVSRTAFNRANTEFHVAIAEAAGNQRVAAAISQVLDGMDRLFNLRLTPSDLTDADRQHKLLIEALQAGDGERAEHIATEHIQQAARKVMDAVFSSSDLMAVEINAGAGGAKGKHP
jgi:DNA-binding GntR family transcriptional regulator